MSILCLLSSPNTDLKCSQGLHESSDCGFMLFMVEPNNSFVDENVDMM